VGYASCKPADALVVVVVYSFNFYLLLMIRFVVVHPCSPLSLGGPSHNIEIENVTEFEVFRASSNTVNGPG